MSRWTFTDGSTSEVVTVEMNPKVSTETISRTLSKATSTAGGRIRWQGRPKPTTFEFEGAARTKDGIDRLARCARKRRQLLLTDDLGRATWVLVTAFKMRPVPRGPVHNRYEFTMSAKKLDVP